VEEKMRITLPIRYRFYDKNIEEYVEQEAIIIMEEGVGVTIMNADYTDPEEYLECVIGPDSPKWREHWENSREKWPVRWGFAEEAIEKGVYDSDALNQLEAELWGEAICSGVGPNTCAFF
jgi:predicted adenine nucleotide alpha hydrolase (AANH) superfamily ATPase